VQRWRIRVINEPGRLHVAHGSPFVRFMSSTLWGKGAFLQIFERGGRRALSGAFILGPQASRLPK
jgi:hypothetical protein